MAGRNTESHSGGLAAGANHLIIVWVNRPHWHSAARPGDTVCVVCMWWWGYTVHVQYIHGTSS